MEVRVPKPQSYVMSYVKFFQTTDSFSVKVPGKALKEAGFDVSGHIKSYDKGISLKQGMLSIMAILTLIGGLSSKRFKRSLENGEAIPPNLKATIKETMDTCVQLTLTLPGTLQVKANHFAGV